ncbi:viral infectivity factor [Simian immunodeficiency virus]|uniref:Virion infectivity factor n=1 Tax=Simian immunodeficiency virus TaxID=11723 RepID=Q87773_SIV|nr:viral infectivity factor [Simian immunodeficiency virus]
MEKEWIVVPTWRMTPRQIDRLQHIIKTHKYKSKELEKATYKHHYQIEWQWYTYCQWTIPVGDGTIWITFYHNLAPERGWLHMQGIRIQYQWNQWNTDLTPAVADRLIHNFYFPCFTARAVNQAVRGELLTSHCWTPHTDQVPSLQYLALQVYLKDGGGFLQSLPACARNTMVLHSKKCRVDPKRDQCHCKGRTGSDRSIQAFYSSRNIWSLESILKRRGRD